MKCWPEASPPEVEAFQYPAVGAATSISWEAFGGAIMTESAEQLHPGTPETRQASEAPASEVHAEELRRSFESGRERGFEEGRAAEREACAELIKVHESRRMEEASRLVESFQIQHTRYFGTVEREVVKLALAVAARILRRETQMDPLLLSSAVRAALGQLSASTQARLRVPASDFELWKDTMANLPNLPVKPAVVADDDMSLGECILETELGSADLGIASQLAEIERGFFDRTEPDRERNGAIDTAKEMSE